jgi:hypothetical protein
VQDSADIGRQTWSGGLLTSAPLSTTAGRKPLAPKRQAQLAENKSRHCEGLPLLFVIPAKAGI